MLVYLSYRAPMTLYNKFVRVYRISLSAKHRSQEGFWQGPVHKHPAKYTQRVLPAFKQRFAAGSEAAGALPRGRRRADEHRDHAPLKLVALDTKGGACTRQPGVNAVGSVRRVQGDWRRAEGAGFPGNEPPLQGRPAEREKSEVTQVEACDLRMLWCMEGQILASESGSHEAYWNGSGVETTLGGSQSKRFKPTISRNRECRIGMLRWVKS
jgi:hypothetical protein